MLTFRDIYTLTSGLPPIMLLSFSCLGGAGTAAVRILEGLLAAGVDAHMLTFQKGDVPQEEISELSDNGKSLFIKNRIYQGISLSRRYPARPNGYESFISPDGDFDLSTCEAISNAGIFHLQRLENLVGWPEAGAIFVDKPIVWTLHSMPAFTGGCSYTAGCEKFISDGCENCPQLGQSHDGKDLAAENFSAKHTGYAGLNINVVTPGHWLGKCARKSRLLGLFPQEVIPYGIDLDTFSPMAQKQARAIFGLPTDKRIVLFSANDVNRRNKGYHIFLEALAYLLTQWADAPPLLLVIGTPPKEMPQGYECFLPGFIADRSKLTAAYAAADVFVSPSFQEAFGQVTAEAQACGTPSIGFYETNAEDIIQDGVTGYLAKHPGLPLANCALPPWDGAYRTFSRESVEDLAVKIIKILELPGNKYEAMRHACRQHAIAEYSPVLQTARYLRLYRKILNLPESSPDLPAITNKIYEI